MSLGAAGLGTQQERVYRMLVRQGDATATQVSEMLDLTDVAVKELMADLQEVGLRQLRRRQPDQVRTDPARRRIRTASAARPGGSRPGPGGPEPLRS